VILLLRPECGISKKIRIWKNKADNPSPQPAPAVCEMGYKLRVRYRKSAKTAALRGGFGGAAARKKAPETDPGPWRVLPAMKAPSPKDSAASQTRAFQGAAPRAFFSVTRYCASCTSTHVGS
jgi:hypothetical protein